MSPRAQRVDPLHIQIANHFKQQILRGELRPGDRLPSVRAIRDEWEVGQNTAQQAIGLLAAGRLVETSPTGTRVAAPRDVLGPQQRLHLTGPPSSEQVTVTFAGMVPCPEYVLPILGLSAGSMVIRREWVTAGPDGEPYMLSVSWLPPIARIQVPELLREVPLPDARGAAPFIAERLQLNLEWGRGAVECRQAKDDGRELVHLRLTPGSYVLAGVNFWSTGGEAGAILEYTEYVLPPGRVIEYDLDL